MTTNIEHQLELAHRDHELRLQGIAATVRTRYVVPFCRRHGLQFFGGDQWFFGGLGKDDYLDVEGDCLVGEVRGEAQRYQCANLLKLLQLMVSDTDELGALVDSYRPGP